MWLSFLDGPLSLGPVEIALGAYAALSLVTFALYLWDKRQAVRGGRRVPEARLHLLALLGGFPGAALGMKVARHKTQKPMFRIVLGLAAAAHVALWVLLWRRGSLS